MSRPSRTLPPLPSHRGSRGPFAESWWGNAWVEALEESSLDAGRLSRGRTYARGGYVGEITVTPGRIAAPVHGSRPRPYRTVVRLRALTDQEWDGFLDAVTAQPAHIAALLDKDMPHELVEAASTAGIQLLPGHGELDPGCSCPDHGYPCKHAAALCYQTARFLDADPFVLLLLRGRDEEELLDELARRNAALSAREKGAPRADEGPGPASGVPARDALATSVRPPLPDPLAPPAAPGEPLLFPELPGAPDPVALTFLATGAAARAHAALTDPGCLNPLPAWHDAIRLAATHPDLTGRGTFSARFAALAHGTGHTTPELARAAAAWRQGGEEGLAVMEDHWDPPAGNFDRARSALAAADLPRMTIHRNHLTDPTRTHQLRYGRDQRWYPYRNDPGGGDDWWPDGPADADPVAALTGLLDA
ncbi:MAG: SWIM zinc finger family protein [Streptomyces sp.]|uniref:SWIM zinc finger family protein n=1 Tax=Streptomyces sp. TaxID=1931 RepID=UPI003D6AD514